MCQALISIYKIFRRQTPVLTDISQRNIRHIDEETNIEPSLTVNAVQNVDNKNSLNDDVVLTIGTMDETYVLTSLIIHINPLVLLNLYFNYSLESAP